MVGTHQMKTFITVALRQVVQDIVASLLVLPNKRRITTLRNGARVQVDTADFVGKRLALYGEYEPFEVGLLGRLGFLDAFVDVGAHIGTYTVSLARVFRRALAIEANPITFVTLVDNIRLNGLDHVRASNIGLGARTGSMPFIQYTTGNQGGSRFVDSENLDLATGGRMIEVRVTTGDELFSDEQLSGKALIKIDVEGYEERVVEGMAGFIAAHKPVLAFEYDLRNGRVAQMPQLLPGYRFYQLRAPEPHFPMFPRLRKTLFRINPTHYGVREVGSFQRGMYPMVVACHQGDVARVIGALEG